jgi:radical SAM superfamily enzyme YgiQ (UPF0313 family)
MGLSIALIRPKPHRDSIGLQQFMVCEPLELEYLASALERAGHHAEILDMILEPEHRLLSFIDSFKPSIVGFTAYLPHVKIVKQYAVSIKERNPTIITVAGGVHAEVNPGDFEGAFDFVVKVNGIKTMVAIAEAVAGGATVETARQAIPGVWSGAGKPYDLETAWDYPFPDREKTARYRGHYNYIFHAKCATIKTSFGCPYRCSFCYCIEITRHAYFERDIADVVEEIKSITEKNIFIVDDNFLVSIPRIREFCRLIDIAGIQKHFILFGRADFIVEHDDIIRLLQEHGLKAVFVGVESFKEEELTGFRKKTTVEVNTRAVGLLDAMGIECYSGIIVGADWGKEDFDSLIRFLNQFKQPLINIQPATPLPGTPLYEQSRDSIIVPREQYHLWDMAHQIMEPTKMSRRRYYFNIMRAYYKTGTGARSHWYVLRKYGLRIYLRIARGALFITWQYLKLALWG